MLLLLLVGLCSFLAGHGTRSLLLRRQLCPRCEHYKQWRDGLHIAPRSASGAAGQSRKPLRAGDPWDITH